MKRAFVFVIVVVASGLAAGAARADSLERGEPAFPIGEFGMSLPLLGNVGGVPVGGMKPLAAGITGYAMLRLDRLALRVEGEVDALVDDQANGTLARAGVAARVQLYRHGGRWSHGTYGQRFAFDVFVEAGVGKQWIAMPGMPGIARHDVELGIGMDPAAQLRSLAGRAWYFGTFYRLRALLAPPPLGSGVEVGVMFDYGFAFGR